MFFLLVGYASIIFAAVIIIIINNNIIHHNINIIYYESRLESEMMLHEHDLQSFSCSRPVVLHYSIVSELL